MLVFYMSPKFSNLCKIQVRILHKLLNFGLM